MYLIKKYSLLAITIFVYSNLRSQNIESLIKNYSEKYTPERAYIHFDKTNYTAGETIWFKVYLMKSLLPADESKNIYIDWIDDKGNVMKQVVEPLLKGVSSGQFDIPVNYSGRSVHVRAYTKWMLNYDADFYYNKDIRILSRSNNKITESGVLNSELTLFPEGGYAVVGVDNKIAFKANDQYGRPINIAGIVIDNNGNVIAAVKILHDGMGYFNITPKRGLQYSVKWKDENAIEHITPLSAIKEMGIAIQVIPMGQDRTFQIAFSPEILKAIDSFHIVGTMYQKAVFSISKAAAAGVKATITTQKLPTGILTITVFDDHWNAIAERITYVNNDRYSFAPQINVQQQSLNKRGKNKIQVSVPDSITSNLSVSITDAAIGSDKSNNNIISQLLLNGELKGGVYNSGYYFSDTTAAIQQDLDLVMLTHGWRRFNWDEITKGKRPNISYKHDSAYIGLSGIIKGIPPDQLTTKDSIILVVKPKGREGQMLVTRILPDGRFNNPYSVVFDTAQLYFHVPEKQIKNISVQFVKSDLTALPVKNGYNTSFFNEDTTGNYHHLFLADKLNDLEQNSKVKLLAAVTVKSKEKKTSLQLLDEKYSSGRFTGKDAYQFDIVNDIRAGSAESVFTFLMGQVPGLQILTETSEDATTKIKITWRPRTAFQPNHESDDGPTIYLNEIPIDLDYVKNMNLINIAYIKVLRPLWNGGGGDAHGAISIYTKYGEDDLQVAQQEESPNIEIVGYTPIREFYTPDYESTDAPQLEPDLRTTLYWNPLVTTTTKEPFVNLTFFNNDVSKAFRIVVEGMTRNGKLAHVEKIIQ